MHITILTEKAVWLTLTGIIALFAGTRSVLLFVIEMSQYNLITEKKLWYKLEYIISCIRPIETIIAGIAIVSFILCLSIPIKCAECGASLYSGQYYCVACGCETRDGALMSKKKSADNDNYCHTCSNKITIKNSSYCGYCGSKLPENSEDTSVADRKNENEKGNENV